MGGRDMRRFAIGCAPFLAILVVLLLASEPDRAGESFDACAAAFPSDEVERAPKRTNPTVATMADSVTLCYHQSGTTFFALDYSVKRLTANWVRPPRHTASSSRPGRTPDPSIHGAGKAPGS